MIFLISWGIFLHPQRASGSPASHVRSSRRSDRFSGDSLFELFETTRFCLIMYNFNLIICNVETRLLWWSGPERERGNPAQRYQPSSMSIIYNLTKYQNRVRCLHWSDWESNYKTLSQNASFHITIHFHTCLLWFDHRLIKVVLCSTDRCRSEVVKIITTGCHLCKATPTRWWQWSLAVQFHKSKSPKRVKFVVQPEIWHNYRCLNGAL